MVFPTVYSMQVLLVRYETGLKSLPSRAHFPEFRCAEEGELKVCSNLPLPFNSTLLYVVSIRKSVLLPYYIFILVRLLV